MIDHSDGSDPRLASTPSGQLGSSTTHYVPMYYTEDNLDVVSYDSRLNSDGSSFFSFQYRIWLANKSTFNPTGEALCHFLLSQASPTIRISCRGTHRIRHRGGRRRSLFGEQVVTDFDFCIDIESNTPVVQWSVADDEPAYRGLMHMVPKVPPKFKKSIGTGRQDAHLYGLRSSKTLRQWADEYCASPKKNKEFVYKKVLFRLYCPNTLFLNLRTPQVIYGWDMEQLKGAIESKIKGYTAVEKININFTTYGSEVRIRPAEFSTLSFRLSKLFTSSESNSGRWMVCGGAYPLKQWVSTTSQRAQGSTETSTGDKDLLGVKEGEWLRKWERVIKRAVRERYQSPIPLNRGFTGSGARASDLDGYIEY